MPYATINVTEIKEGSGGRKFALVDDTGTWYWVWADKVDQYQEGYTYEIEYHTSQSNGRTYNNVGPAPRGGGARGGTGNSGYRAPPQQGGGYSRAAPQQRTPAPQQRAPAPQAQAGQFYRPTSPEDKLSMFVTATVKAGVQSGQVQFNEEAIAIAVVQAVTGYKNGWQEAAKINRPAPQQGVQARTPQTSQEELNDEIPF